MTEVSGAANVYNRFKGFLGNLALTPAQRTDGERHRASVVSCLNRNYYGASSAIDNTFLIGSWGKNTVMRPPRDIDIYFKLPASVYERFNKRTGNKQSQLLQEVKSTLESTFTRTNMKGDGQIVLVGFEAYDVEVVPAFELSAGGYYICNTRDGGSYKTTYPHAEVARIEATDASVNGELRDLIRMVKCWQDYCSVWSLKSFWIELIATDFIGQWKPRGQGVFWYDWMVRDFFLHLETKINNILYVPGSYEPIFIGDAWHSRVTSAASRATKATQYDADNKPILAGEEWQKIFGPMIPWSV